MSTRPGLLGKTIWTLAEYSEGNQQKRVVDLPARPILVGRSHEADLSITHGGVSKQHASIHFEQNHMVVEDLGSTNGTYVNGNRIECSVVGVGDLLQFGNALYRVGCRGNSVADGTIEEGILPWAQTLILFDRLLTERAVVPHFQQIVSIDDRTCDAHELLARSDLDGLSNPALMFGAAERLGQQAALSELMRCEGLKVAQSTDHVDETIFVNTHPSEVITERLIASLTDLRADWPDASIAVEIHEAAVTDPQSMREFQAFLTDNAMLLSYDDFGAGQGRLCELGEVPPAVLKFDMQLIRNIDSASRSRQDLLSSLVRISLDLGTRPLAEGIETEAEHTVCQQMGFELAQGFFYGRPLRWN